MINSGDWRKGRRISVWHKTRDICRWVQKMVQLAASQGSRLVKVRVASISWLLLFLCGLKTDCFTRYISLQGIVISSFPLQHKCNFLNSLSFIRNILLSALSKQSHNLRELLLPEAIFSFVPFAGPSIMSVDTGTLTCLFFYCNHVWETFWNMNCYGMWGINFGHCQKLYPSFSFSNLGNSNNNHSPSPPLHVGISRSHVKHIFCLCSYPKHTFTKQFQVLTKLHVQARDVLVAWEF